MTQPRTLSRSAVWSQAWPLILASATTPLLGLVDTAVLGHSGDASHLAALALGSLIFNFMYWSFGFLRMSTTGFVAQAKGSHDPQELGAGFVRPLLLGLGVGVALFAFSPLLADVAFELLSAGAREEQLAWEYLSARIFGAPLALAGLGATGVLIGLGASRQVLWAQLLLNGLNAALDIIFVSVCDWGAAGVGWGTAIAESVGALFSVFLAWGALRSHGVVELPFQRAFQLEGLKKTMSANGDIMIRTLAMIFSFAVFTDNAARFGAVQLAANHLLLQFVSFSAFFLDGFAHVAESHVGHAIGAGKRGAFKRALRLTSEAAALSAGVLALAIFSFGGPLTRLLTNVAQVQITAQQYLLPACVYILFSVGAFQLDGVYIGASWTRRMRNASVFCSALFLAGVWWVVPRYENAGLWWVFVAYVTLRGLSLGTLLPRALAEVSWRRPSIPAAVD